MCKDAANKTGKTGSIIFLLLVISLGCSEENKKAVRKNELIRVVCTTGMIGDAVGIITGGKVRVETLMGPGVDPHLYKASHGDLAKFSEADIIFYNGLHLEGKMGEVLNKLSRRKKVVAVADGVPPERLMAVDTMENAHDPHIWFDVAIWSEAVRHISEVLQMAHAVNAGVYKMNADAYLSDLEKLHDWVGEKIKEVPEEARVLVTAHDAFGYFGRAYGMKVRGLQGISTASEYGLRDVTEMVDFLCERKIKAVFVESSVPQKALKAVVEGCNEKGHSLSIGGTLYSDAMGADGTEEGTYTGMVRKNVEVIVNALK